MSRTQKKIFIVLFFSIFSAITGVGIVVPLLPIYANDLGASGVYISLIFGSFSISRTLLLPVFGQLSDKKGRKPYIVLGLFAYALVSAGFMFAANIEALISLRFLHGIASAMVMPVAQAYVGDITPEGKEGLYMGLFNLSMFASLSLGPFMGGIINHQYGLNTAFAAMGIMALIASLLSLCLLPQKDLGRKPPTETPRKTWGKAFKSKTIIGLFLFRVTYTTCVGVVWCFLPLFAAKTFEMNTAETGGLVTTMVLVSGLLHAPMGYIADRISPRFLVLVGSLFITFSMALCAKATGYFFLMGTSIAFGIGGGISLPAVSAMAIIEGRKESAMGVVMAILTVGHSLGMLAGSLLAGITMDTLGLTYAFPVGALAIAMGLIAFMILTRGKKNTPSFEHAE